VDAESPRPTHHHHLSGYKFTTHRYSR
jgi:hypothetical protein